MKTNQEVLFNLILAAALGFAPASRAAGQTGRATDRAIHTMDDGSGSGGGFEGRPKATAAWTL
jgi:hypothetical protein